mmetsp:Transcript_4522/g.13716  ORF Transcript_4522/g.13716 Transcript_4522/m.13716 type:complete len:143 (+) Transcript_4522:130-558(+)|eukprot:CAMPEP_0198727816 /NCGR_PEP_ID=MMETSP1475-20131203/5554_1 /TAXON_ID= ORGANISM="Unidentified sp., Strain CCMP1999" /NCGR_SAMPLE_ID=MMETSP1475 /ASSEMBLY_ACC=CAM_ASM_001111 /LENGTH=142 /DNA_ID=CAMNT_0044489975 /DNA_START=107 /DNA_END=535 /DNA_ORIENTATION=+
MASAKAIGSIVCRLLLTAVFGMAATVKLTDRFDAKAHGEMVGSFPQYASVLMGNKIGFNGDQLRVFVATLEIIAVVLLWIVPLAGSFLLSSSMVGAVYVHYALREYSRMQPPTVLGALAAVVFLLSTPAGEPAPPRIEKKTE